MSFLDIFAYTVVISRETVKSPKNTIFDTCAQNSWRYEFSDIFAHTVVISCKTVKSGKNTFCDICAQNSRRYEFCDLFTHTVRITVKWSDHIGTRFVILVYRTHGDMSFLDIFAYTVVISHKTVKSAKNTVCDICDENWRNTKLVVISRETVKHLRTRFLTLVHKTRGDMSFPTFLLIQL